MFREILETTTPDFSVWKVNKSTLEDEVDRLDKALKNIVGNTNGGLVPDVIRTSKEYEKANAMFKKAFKKLQDFNKQAPKGFLKKLSKESRIRRYSESKNSKLDDLYDFYKDEANGDSLVLHQIIKDRFVNNSYARASNKDIEYMWTLYKKDKDNK
jgi:hypothetical protein